MSHGHGGLVRRLLTSLECHHPCFPLEVLLTLNSGEPNPTAELDLGYPVIVIRNPSPRGFASNHNRASRRGRGEYFCVLNPDIVFVEPVFGRLMSRLDAGAEIAAPLVVDPNGMRQDTYRRLPKVHRLLARFRSWEGPEDLVAIGVDGLAHPDWIAGMFLLMKAEFFRRLGGFDERYFLYYEDADLGTRCRLAGGVLVVDTGVRVMHEARRDSRQRRWFLKRHLLSALRFFLSRPYWQARARQARGVWAGVLIGLAAAGSTPQASAQAPRLIDPGTEAMTYDVLESIALRGERTGQFLIAKPWSSHDVAEFLSIMDSIQPGTGAAQWLSNVPREEVELSVGRAADDAGVAGLRHALTIEPRAAFHASAGRHEFDPPFLSIRRREAAGDPDWSAGGDLHAAYSWLPGGVSASVDLRGQTNTRNAFDYRERDEDGAVDVRSAYVMWQNPRFLVAAGRLPVEWGTGPIRGIGLTAMGPALDGVLARGRWGIVQLSLFSAFLPDERANRRLAPDGNTVESSDPEADDGPLVNRYFFAHRVDLRLGDRFALAINEMAVVTGVRRRPDFQFLTGLVPYVVAQNSRDEIDARDINLGAGLQYRWRLPGRILLYGEYFANEVFLDTDLGAVLDGLVGRRENTQGFQQGVRWAAPFGWQSIDLEAEVLRIEPFLYLHRGLNTNWRAHGVPLGAPLGPDNQRALLRLRYYRPAGEGLFRGTAEVAHRERGLLRITDDADIQGAGRPRSVPSEPAESMWLGTLAAELWWPRAGGAGIRVKGGRVRTFNNIVGERVTPFDLEFYVSFGPALDAAF